MFSSESETSRCVAIDQLAGAPSAKEINALFNASHVLRIAVKVHTDITQLNSFPSRTHLLVGELNKVYLKFADIRDAEKAITWVNTLSHKWSAQYIQPTEFALKAVTESSMHIPVLLYEGQVDMKATFAQCPKPIDVDATGKFISELVSDYGNVMAFEVRPGKAMEVSYHMEFCDIRASEKALADLKELRFDVSLTPTQTDTCRKLTHRDFHLDHQPPYI